LLHLIFQLIKRQFGIAGRVTGAAAVGATVQAAAIVSLELARHIRDKLPVRIILNWRLGSLTATMIC